MSGDNTVIEIKAQCLCKAQVFTASIPKSSLPLEASSCHCNSCRHHTGALYASDAPWPGPIEQVLESSLSRYHFTRNVDVLFCGNCSANMFFHEHYAERPESVGVYTGALLNHNVPNLITFTDHIFVGDTVDGGATPWLTSLNADGTPTRRWYGAKNKSEELTHRWPSIAQLSAAEDKPGPGFFPIRCHCKGVDLVLRRQDATSHTDSKNLPWFIDPRNLKHTGSFDVCDPCRNSFGVDFVHWTFVLMSQLDFADGRQEPNKDEQGFPRDSVQLKDAISRPDKDSRFGTLAMYASSPDVQRYFCSRCSASVFYAVDDRPEMINIGIGLLDAPEGARAESLLAWAFGSTIGNAADTKGGWRERLAGAVQKDAEAWRIERGYPKSYKRLMTENIPQDL